MSLTKLEKDMGIIQKLDDEPNDVGGLSAADLKKKFDESGETVKTFLNDTLIPEIEQSFAETAKKQDLSDVVLGQIPDHTLTEEKLSEDLSEKLNSAAPKETVFTREETLTQKTAALLGIREGSVPDDAFMALFIGANMYAFYVHVTWPDGTNRSGLTITGIEELYPGSLQTDEDGYAYGKSSSPTPTIVAPNPDEFIDIQATSLKVENENSLKITNVELVTKYSPTTSKTFNSSQSIKFSSMPNIADFCAVGAGEGGQSGDYYDSAGAGGDGGDIENIYDVDVSSAKIDLVIGAGGANGGGGRGELGGPGGDTTISKNGENILTAKGGGSSGNKGTGGRGGSPHSNGSAATGKVFDTDSTASGGGGGGGNYQNDAGIGGSPNGGAGGGYSNNLGQSGSIGKAPGGGGGGGGGSRSNNKGGGGNEGGAGAVYARWRHES